MNDKEWEDILEDIMSAFSRKQLKKVIEQVEKQARQDERKNVLEELEKKGEVISTWMCPTCGKAFSKAWLKIKKRR